MSFFSPILKVFTPMHDPPHPNLLWDLPESALANECLPDHQNNAMFIPEVPPRTLCEQADGCLQPDLSNVRLDGGDIDTNGEFFTGLEIDGRERPMSTSCAEIQRKYREVDIWLEDQCRNHTESGPTIDYCRESPSYDDRADAFPHDLLVQMGLANSNMVAPRPSHTMGRYMHQNDLLARDCEEEQHVLGEQDFQSVGVNVNRDPKIFDGVHYDDRADYNGPHDNLSEPTITYQREKSLSSLSQLFQDEELNDEDMKEIAQSIKTINRNVGNRGHHLDGNAGNHKTTTQPQNKHKATSGFQSQYLVSSFNSEMIPNNDQRKPSGGVEMLPNDTENLPSLIQGISNDLKLLQNPPLSSKPSLELLEIPQTPLAKSTPKIAEILENTPKPIPGPHFVGMLPMRTVPESLEVMETPPIARPSPKIVQMEQIFPLKSTPNVVQMASPLKPSSQIAELLSIPPLNSPDLKIVRSASGTMDVIPKCQMKLDTAPNKGETRQKAITTPEISTNLKVETKLTPKLGKIAQTPIPTFSQTTPKNQESTQCSSEKPTDSPKFRKPPHCSPENTNSATGFLEMKHPDTKFSDVIYENNNLISEQCVQEQSSLSQLFQTQEFTVDQYMDTVRSNFQRKPDESTADPVKLTDEMILPSSGEEIPDSNPEVRGNVMKINSQPFVIRGNEPKLFDISVEREEDRPWKKQVTEGVLEPSNEVSKRDEKSMEEIPMVVSPYFPNDSNHPVQDEKRTASSNPTKFSVSQVLDLSQDNSSQDVLGKILNYERAADDYQICKDFFSQHSPQQTPKSKGNDSDQRKRVKPNEERTSKSKKPRISKKEKVDCHKITNYFSVVKKCDKNETKGRGHRTKLTEESSPKRSDKCQDIERTCSKFQFVDLPPGTQMKMSHFYAPQTDAGEKPNLNPSGQMQEEINDAATPPPEDLKQNVQPEAVARLNSQVSTQNQQLSPEVNSQAMIEFNCFPREHRHLTDEDYKVIFLEEEKVEEIASSMENSGDLVEIGFTICYRQKYSRLNMPDDGGTLHSPCGIMSRVQFADCKTLVLYQDINALGGENGRSFILCLLESKCRKVCFEAQAFIMFVLDVLREQDLRICYDWHLLDPMIGMWLMDPDHPAQNFTLLLKELELEVVKNESDDWKVTVSRYLSIQSLVIERLYDILSDLGLWDVFYRMETPITPILAAMELRNIEVDHSRLRETSKVLQKKMSDIEQDAWKLVGKKFQMSSPVQLRRILYEELKLDKIGSINIKCTATSKAKSTDEGTLKSLAGLHPLPGLILEYRHAHKIRSTYIDGLLAHVVNKRTVSTTWEQCAAATGRITSSNPNMQSIPKRNEDMMIAEENFNVRKVFTSRPGRKFIAVDFQQIELRTFAHLSKDGRLISVFKQPGDIFITMTKLRLGTVDFDANEREKTKTLMYALLYGAGAYKISEVLSIDAESANRVCADFYKLFPGLKNFRSSVLEESRARKQLRSLSGRRRLFPLVSASCIKQKRYTERQAVNFTIQGSAADICKAAMLRTELALRECGFDVALLLQIHDELLWEVPEDLESKVKDTIRQSIEETSDYWTKKFNLNVPMPVKITTGSSWGSMN